MESSESGRPAKKARLEGPGGTAKSKETPKWRPQQIEYKRQQRRAEIDHPGPESAEHRRDRELFGIDEDNQKEIGLEPLQEEGKEKLRKLHVPKMFSQPSVMASGDKGIFVTCDKGREKKCLTELADLVEEYLEKKDLIPAQLVDPKALLDARVERQSLKAATIAVDNEESPVEEEEIDIESSINAELSGLKSPQHGDPGSHQSNSAPTNVRAFQLITLDVPCVSFLRFVPTGLVFDKVDVVDVVHSICADAAKNPGRMRSRFIRRLSPVIWLGKVLSGGLERACEETLPTVFKIEGDEADVGGAANSGLSFAIKPTVRNNSKVSSQDTIKQVAEQVQRLGNGKHKVDLKGYEKGVLVEVYRGWVGMSIVDNTSSTTSGDEQEQNKVGYGFGYEALKRFNLAEIYAEGLKKADKSAED